MSRNVEIKAKVQDHDETVRRAVEISGKQPSILRQHDIFYESPNGRLKMRSVEENGVTRTELIWYDRPDVAGPKLSEFNKFDVPAEILDALKLSLLSSMGVKGEVKKTRTLVLHGQTRIHIDRVDGLGDFMELEVCLAPEETVEQGEQIAQSIREQLGVAESDLLVGAYMDMLMA
uniref:CYTH domain-containing protein n=1 Tax=Caenorhabditis japonica TaxID=281687 RepID=A0A8R1DL84_CAEJA